MNTFNLSVRVHSDKTMRTSKRAKNISHATQLRLGHATQQWLGTYLFLLTAFWRPPQTRKHCRGNIVSQNVSRLRAHATCVAGAKFAPLANVSLFAQQGRKTFFFCFMLFCAPKKYFGKQCFGDVSSFVRALTSSVRCQSTIESTC